MIRTILTVRYYTSQIFQANRMLLVGSDYAVNICAGGSLDFSKKNPG